MLILAYPADAAVFGDGNPKNGPEDDRVPIDDDDNLARQLKATGLIYCDNVVRGSATVLDISDFADDQGYSVIATSAHIFFEGGTHRRRKSCWFHPHRGSNYRRPIEFSRVIMGDYIPKRQQSTADFGEDWAFVWLGSNMEPFGASLKPALIKDGSASLLQSIARLGVFAVAGYNSQERQITVNLGCHPVPPPWKNAPGITGKVVFTDCEGGQGSSGGAVAMAPANEFRIIGIFSGHYWRQPAESSDPRRDEPEDGSPYSRTRNSNFFRLFDKAMIDAIKELVAG
ncbi:MAG: hypothetical protein O2910_03100 [Proteobacteria bacterium]|nr:hypothetical protein [Pseudomonadota bacterium]